MNGSNCNHTHITKDNMVTSKAVHPTMQLTQMQTPQNWEVLKQKK
jgi:hypothetical protein